MVTDANGTRICNPFICSITVYFRTIHAINSVSCCSLTLTVLVAIIDAQWEGMGDIGSARYEPALLPPCPTIKVLSYSNK